jgi:hypothetical protein
VTAPAPATDERGARRRFAALLATDRPVADAHLAALAAAAAAGDTGVGDAIRRREVEGLDHDETPPASACPWGPCAPAWPGPASGSPGRPGPADRTVSARSPATAAAGR